MSWPLFDTRYRELIDHYDDFISSLETPRPVGLRPNLNLTDLTSFSAIGPSVKVYEDFEFYHSNEQRKFWGGRLEHHLGHYFIQALSSVIPIYAFDNLRGARAIDLCAAPGGKSTLLAELVGPDGLVVCNEPSLSRRRILKANIERMGHAHCAVSSFDATEESFKKESFDCVLLDGPCSSEGTFHQDMIKGARARSDNFLTYNKTFRDSLHQTQKKLIKQAFDLLKVGGQMIYSTCTYDPDENEGCVQHLLDYDQRASVEKVYFKDPHLLQAMRAGITQWNDKVFDSSLENSIRLYPHHTNSIGFYFAKISKRS